MAACMHAVLRDSDLSLRLRQKGLDRAREFTWERCARQTLEVLMKVGQANRN
jgi:glycosyltransferase involved in cell wall biosynthesis